jgi:hypothetical protein
MSRESKEEVLAVMRLRYAGQGSITCARTEALSLT